MGVRPISRHLGSCRPKPRSDASLVPKERVAPSTLGFIHGGESAIRSGSYLRFERPLDGRVGTPRVILSSISSSPKAVSRFPGVTRSRLRVTLALPPSPALRQPHPQQTSPFHLRGPGNGQGRAGESPPTPHGYLLPPPRPQILLVVAGGCLRIRVCESLSGVALGLGPRAEAPDLVLGPPRPGRPCVTGLFVPHAPPPSRCGTVHPGGCCCCSCCAGRCSGGRR